MFHCSMSSSTARRDAWTPGLRGSALSVSIEALQMIALTVAQSHTTPAEWLFVVGALVILGAAMLGLLAAGRTPISARPRDLVVRIGDGLGRVTGLPAYAAAAIG